jgi:hypothetical protein
MCQTWKSTLDFKEYTHMERLLMLWDEIDDYFASLRAFTMAWR